MEQAYVQRLEQLIEYFPEGSKCHQQGVEKLCKARDIGMDSFVECLEKEPLECVCAIHCAHSWYCSCPPRIRIAKELNV